MVDAVTVHDFQRKLQGLLKQQATSNIANWETLFSPRHVLHQHPLAKLLNQVVSTNGIWECEESSPDPRLDLGDEDVAMIATTEDKPPSWW